MLLTGDDIVLFFGASRGLGEAVQRDLLNLHPETKSDSLSRRSEMSFDFSKPEQWPSLWDEILKRSPSRIWYFAGGGPFGDYGKKQWKDHQWAYRVNFECPAFLLHCLLQNPGRRPVRQVVYIGSAVAEAAPDPGAASYSAAKHALRGLVTSVQMEWQHSAPFDLRLFSPTYLDTPLLPKSAKPRQVPGKLRSVEGVAREFLDWVCDDQEFCRNLSHS